MAIRQSALIKGASVAVAESVYMSPDLAVDITIRGKRYLQAGYVETDSGQYDTSIFTAGYAGSMTPSSSGSCKRYVRIS